MYVFLAPSIVSYSLRCSAHVLFLFASAQIERREWRAPHLFIIYLLLQIAHQSPLSLHTTTSLQHQHEAIRRILGCPPQVSQSYTLFWLDVRDGRVELILFMALMARRLCITITCCILALLSSSLRYLLPLSHSRCSFFPLHVIPIPSRPSQCWRCRCLSRSATPW